MASLRVCLKRIGLDSHEAAILRGKVSELKEDGYAANEAATLAVNEYIDELEAEALDIYNQIARKTNLEQKKKIEGSAIEDEQSIDETQDDARENTLDHITQAAQSQPTKDKYLSYLRGRIGKQEFAKQKDKIEQAWERERGGQPKLSRNDTWERKTSNVSMAVNDVVKNWKHIPDRIRVIQSVSDLPKHLVDYVKNQNAESDAAGLYDARTSHIYLVADNLKSEEHAQKVFLHEAFGHYGFAAIAPEDQRVPLLNAVYEARRDHVRQIAKRYGLNLLTQRDRLEAAEEVLAHMAEDGDTSSVFTRVLSTVKQWIRKYFPNLKMSDAEIRGLLGRMGRAAKTKTPKTSKVEPPAIAHASMKRGEAMFSRSGKQFGDITQAQRQALKNTGGIVSPVGLSTWIKNTKQNLGLKLAQGIADQFAPIKNLDPHAYVLSRLSKASDGALEALLMYGNLRLVNGVTDSDASGVGLIDTLQKLQGEQERFLWWIAANRAEKLKAQGRENLFSDTDISELKTLNQGAMPDGSNRQDVYNSVFAEFKSVSKNVLDIAEQSGLIDAQSRSLWENDFYVPFYRVMEEGLAGPTVKSGLVKQYAFKKLKGGNEKLNADLLANTLMNWTHLLSASAKNRAAKAALDAGARAGVATPIQSEVKGSVFYLDGGDKKYFLISDPLVMDAITALEWTGFGGPAMKAMSKFKHYLTVGVTANPTFKIRNLIRDSIASVATTPLSYNVAGNVAKGAKAVANKKGQTFASMLASGGLIRFGSMLEGNRSHHVQKLINAGVKESTILDTKEKIADVMQTIWARYNEISDISENANRAALFEQVLSRTGDLSEAAYQARDLLDFSMGGTYGAVRFLTQVVPFMNARIQGLYKLGRSAKKDKLRFSAVTGAVALASIALLLKYRDDEDWKAREDWDRDTYHWFKFDGIAYRLPRAFEIGAIGTLAERSVELLLDDEMTGERFGGRMKDMLMNTFAMNPIPQLFKPLIDVYANKDSFTKRPIESMGMERLKKADRYTENTTQIAKFLGLAGEYTNISPVQFDHMIKAYFGWLGTMAATASTYGAELLVDAPSRPSVALKDVFLAGNFVEELPARNSRYLTAFYEQAKEIEEAYSSYHHYLKVGEKEKALKTLEQNKDKIAKFKVATKLKQNITEINNLIRQIKWSKTASPEFKRAEIDRLLSLKRRYAKTFHYSSSGLSGPGM